MSAERKWRAAEEEHRAALRRFAESAESLPETGWTRHPAPGKWSPAEVCEHLALAYEALLREMEGGPGMRLLGPPWRRTLLRWILLPHVLFHRSFPLRAPAPREIRHPEGNPDRAAALERLRAFGERFEREVGALHRSGRGGLTHPYFGSLAPLKALRFVAVHLDHHRRQLSA